MYINQNVIKKNGRSMTPVCISRAVYFTSLKCNGELDNLYQA